MKSPVLCIGAVALFLAAVGCGGASTHDETPAVGDQAEVAVMTDPGTESELYEAAQRAEHGNRPQEAIRLYRRILSEYPDSPDNYKAQFLIGFVFSEELGMPDSARVAFELVVRDYPNSEFVNDAEAMINFLDGKMPAFEESPAP